MIRLAVSVEGQTEEEFTNIVLATHLRSYGVFPQPILLGRARGTSVSGGNVTVERLASEMAYLSGSFDAVTSLVDYYGFRDKSDKTIEDLERLVLGSVWQKIAPSQRKVLPYVQKHEFEALLFSDVDAFSARRNIRPHSVRLLRAVQSGFDTPEDINDNRATAPSRRIAQILPSYSKRLDGPIIASDIGLPTIRAVCPRFNKWITTLEALTA